MASSDLLANGADVNLGERHYDLTSVEFAMSRDHYGVVESLIARPVDILPLHFALHMEDVTIAKGLVEGGVDDNKRTPYGTTPLHRVVRAGVTDIAALLIDRGADVSAKDNWDRTPLNRAIYGHEYIVELLIARGANINTKGGPGRTPLRHADKEGHAETVELVKKYGAKE